MKVYCNSCEYWDRRKRSSYWGKCNKLSYAKSTMVVSCHIEIVETHEYFGCNDYTQEKDY